MKDSRTGYQMVFTAGVIWGFIGFFVNSLSSLGVRTEMIPVLRLGFSTLCMLAVCIAIRGKDLRPLDLKGVGYSALMGLVSQAIFNLCYTNTIKYVGVSTGAIMLYTAPVFACITSRILYKEELSVNKIVALLLNIVGCVLTVTGGDFRDVSISAPGIAFGLATGLCYSMLPVILKKATVNYDPMVMALYGSFFGAFFMFFIGRGWQGPGCDISVLLAVVAVGYGLSTAAAYFLFSFGMSKKIQASKAPVVASIEVIVAAVIGIALYSEGAGPGKMLGILLVMISIVVMNREKPIFTKVSQ